MKMLVYFEIIKQFFKKIFLGYQLLKKMGWKDGEGLGKENKGIIHPLQVFFKKSFNFLNLVLIKIFLKPKALNTKQGIGFSSQNSIFEKYRLTENFQTNTEES